MKKLDWTIFLIGFVFGVMCTLSVVGMVTRSINDELRALHLEHELLKMKFELKGQTNESTVPEDRITFTLRGDIPEIF